MTEEQMNPGTELEEKQETQLENAPELPDGETPVQEEDALKAAQAQANAFLHIQSFVFHLSARAYLDLQSPLSLALNRDPVPLHSYK